MAEREGICRRRRVAKLGRRHAKSLVGGAVWSLCNLELEEKASQKVGERNKFNLIGDLY